MKGLTKIRIKDDIIKEDMKHHFEFEDLRSRRKMLCGSGFAGKCSPDDKPQQNVPRSRRKEPSRSGEKNTSRILRWREKKELPGLAALVKSCSHCHWMPR